MKAFTFDPRPRPPGPAPDRASAPESARAPARLITLVAALVLAGCAGISSNAPAPAPAAPAAFREEGGARFVSLAPAESQAGGAWWRVFGDPVLDDLVDRAGASNTDLQTAAARVREARAMLQAARADLLPQAGLQAGVQRATLPPGQGGRPGQALTVGSAGLAASWEPDLFGRVSQARDAAGLDVQAREALLQSTRLLVQSEVALAYFELRALDVERALVRQTIEAYGDTLRLTESRFRAGDVAELDLARVQSEVASTRSQALALDRLRALDEHALAVLLGEVPSNFVLPEGEWGGVLPLIPPGVPASVLARRPDVAAAQFTLQAAQARAGVARKAWFPDVALTANGGFASDDLGNLFKWSARAWGVGALLSLPVFDAGRRTAGIEQAEAQWDAAAAGYRAQVLAAVRDVEDQLASLRLLADQAESEQQAVDAAQRATRLSDARYRLGLVNQLELLDARRSELADRRAAVQVRAARYAATIGLVRAIGGDWSRSPAAPTPAS